MNIYYPSVERNADNQRRERHDKVAQFISDKGVELFGRPSLYGSNRINWLGGADGVVVERLNFTHQLERECRYASRIGKEVLVIMDHTDPARTIGARQPSEAFRQLAMDGLDRDDENIRIVNSAHTVGDMPELMIVQSAVNVFLAARLREY